MFVIGTCLAGLGAGLFRPWAPWTAMMRSAPRAQVGLALGAWGAVQATAAGHRRGAWRGVIRDLILAPCPRRAAFRPEPRTRLSLRAGACVAGRRLLRRFWG